VVLPYNDIEATGAAVERYGDRLACIIVEPVAANMGVVSPVPGFLEALRSLADECGALLVFDEVVTGFRLGRGGAQERFGILPDLTVLGKVAGGGLPLAAFGGPVEVMDELAPSGPVYQAGTLSGNPLATAAALAVLRRLRDPRVYTSLESSAAALAAGVRDVLDSGSVTVQQVGPMLTVFFRAEPVRNFTDASACDRDAYAAFFRLMLEHEVYVPPSQFEAMFVSTAHGDDEIAQTIEAARALDLSG
jgi:glutamate-1-semialdehyde 2,1-aminomutase